MVRKLEAEGPDRSNRQEYLLEAVLKAVLLIGHVLRSGDMKFEELVSYFTDPDDVHIQKPIREPKFGAAAEMRKANQDVGEWILTLAQQQGITLTKKK